MTGFSTPEFLLLLVIGLVVLGPKRLPEIANKVGGWIGQARRMTRIMKRQLEEELNLDGNPSIGKRPFVPPSVAADGATKVDEASEPPEAHVPNEDDTFSPLHPEEDADDGAKTGNSA
jgi:sec-independent protein translocase protein TatB